MNAFRIKRDKSKSYLLGNKNLYIFNKDIGELMGMNPLHKLMLHYILDGDVCRHCCMYYSDPSRFGNGSVRLNLHRSAAGAWRLARRRAIKNARLFPSRCWVSLALMSYFEIIDVRTFIFLFSSFVNKHIRH